MSGVVEVGEAPENVSAGPIASASDALCRTSDFWGVSAENFQPHLLTFTIHVFAQLLIAVRVNSPNCGIDVTRKPTICGKKFIICIDKLPLDDIRINNTINPCNKLTDRHGL